MRSLLADAAWVVGTVVAVVAIGGALLLLVSGDLLWGLVLLAAVFALIAVTAWLDHLAHAPRRPRRDSSWDGHCADAARVLSEPTVPLHVAEAISAGKCWPGCGCTQPSPLHGRRPQVAPPKVPPPPPLPRALGGQAAGPAKMPPPTSGPATPIQPSPPGRVPFGMAVYHPYMPPEPWFPHEQEARDV